MSAQAAEVIRRIGYLAIVAGSTAYLLAAGPAAEAFTCTQTSGVYTCTGVVQGDALVTKVDETIGTDVLLATATISVIDVGTGFVDLGISITNDSSLADRITIYGLSIDPSATGGTITGATELTTFSMSNFPGFTSVELCATAGANCAGGGGGGIDSGTADDFILHLTNGYTNDQAISLGQFAFKFQGGLTSYETPGTPTDDGTTPPNAVPEPSSLVLLGTALVGLAASPKILRRRSQN